MKLQRVLRKCGMYEDDYEDYHNLKREFEKAKAIVKFFTGHLSLTDKEIEEYAFSR